MRARDRAEEAEHDLSDEQLVRRLAGGDRSALGELYDRYAPILIAVGQKILQSRRDAEDLAHDVFVEAWRAAGDYDAERGTVRAWLVMRARSRALDRCRSAWARGLPLDGQPEPVAAETRESAPTADHRVLHRALSALTPEQRTVLELGYFEGLSSSEIALRINTPIGTVKSRVAAALTRLRAGLADQERS